MADVVESVRPRFYSEPIENRSLSEKEGRPIFETKTFVELKQPGDKLWTFVEEIDGSGRSLAKRQDRNGHTVGEDYSERFPKEYAAFKRGEERAASGTPLDEWGMISRSRAAELKAQNVWTVEELSNIPDNLLQKLGMSTRAEREKARTFLDTAKAGANEAKLSAEVAELRAMIEAMRNTPQPVVAVGASAPSDLSDPQMGEISAPREKTLDECTDAELKDFIRRETGETPRGNPSRETLMKRAAELAQSAAA